jgi:ribosome-binding protein aMBF1 (putative translation factor)
MTQEIMIQDIRSAGATVIATDTEDVETLQSSEHDHTRMLVRDVLARVEEYREAFGLSREVEPAVEAANLNPELSVARETTDVVVELIVPGA